MNQEIENDVTEPETAEAAVPAARTAADGEMPAVTAPPVLATLSRRSRTLGLFLFVLFLYVAQAIIVKLLTKDGADGDATVVIGAFTTLFGVGLTALALPGDYLSALRLRLRTRRAGVTVPATVAATRSFHGTDFHYPVYAYAGPDGTSQQAADPAGRPLAVGTAVRIRLLPADLARAAGPLGRLHAGLFGALALLGLTIALIMPVLTLKAILG